MMRIYAAGSLTAVLLLSAGCGGAEDVLGDAVGAASCAAAEQAVSPVKDRVRSAVESLGVDPAGAQRELEVLKGTVDAAAQTVSGEVQQSLENISGDLGVLIDEARGAARGAVDQSAVDQAQAELGTAVDDVTRIC